MEHDWGSRDERWAGVRSDVVAMQGTDVHVLRAEGAVEGPTHLLVHGLGGSGTNWLEVIAGLAETGPVVAPDLPGFGRTEPPRPGASRIQANLGFLKAFVGWLGAKELVVHGNSMGGMLATLLAAERPEVVRELVLVDPGLPGPRNQLNQLTKQTMKNFAPFAVPGLGRRVLGKMYTRYTPEELFAENQAYVHADPTRVNSALREVGLENTGYGMRTPWRLDGMVSAAESLVSALLMPAALHRAVDAVEARTLVVWGDQDQLIGRPVIDLALGRRPDWDLHVFEGVGHVPMMETPDDYLHAVNSWRVGHNVKGPTAAAS